MSDYDRERFKRTGIRRLEYDLIGALRRAKTQIMAGDCITDIAADLLIELNDENAVLKNRVDELDQRCAADEDTIGLISAEKDYLRAQLAESQKRVDVLEVSLDQAASSIEAEIEANYSGTKDHPAMKRRYDRDMSEVHEYRALLKKGKDNETTD